jgi:hypothetical protein
MPMDVRLVQLLGSFITARSQYALARLELAMHFPKEASPPVIGRLEEPSEEALRDQWPRLEEQLEAALAYAASLERSKRRKVMKDEGFRFLQRTLRELDQYARAIRWVITVTESGER